MTDKKRHKSSSDPLKLATFLFRKAKQMQVYLPFLKYDQVALEN